MIAPRYETATRTAIVLPDVVRPLVSIVMVIYGAWELARQSLQSVLEHTEPCYDVIIVDNASPDGAGEFLVAEVRGATVIRNQHNVGFGAGVNQGVLQARGTFLCLLNSDAFVLPGWLEPLISTLDAEPAVGAVASMLLNEDGTLQEAGSVVGRDGSTQALGYGDDPTSPEYCFRRDVDYVSAACLLMRRRTFTELGGFDPAYPVAYCEDVDLCFALSDIGLRTVYQPASKVIHVRGASSTHEQAAQLMEENRVILRARWGRKLASRHPLNDIESFPLRLLANRDAEALDRILVVDDRVPHHDRGSGDPRMAKFLIELATLWPRARITLLPADGQSADRYAPPLLARGIEVADDAKGWKHWLESRSYHYSAVVVSRPNNYERFDEVIRRTQPQALRVYDVEALFFRRVERSAKLALTAESRAEALAESSRLRNLEIGAITSADLVLCVSDEEQEFVRGVAPQVSSLVIPDLSPVVKNPAGFEARDGLLFFAGFMGGAGAPNEDAVQQLVHYVLPSFRSHETDTSGRDRKPATLHIVGADPTPVVKRSAGPGVEVVGFVADPAPWLQRARVHVVPLRIGAGVKHRLVETMSAGLPFVTTTVGAEGLPLDEVRHLIVADDPEEIARLAWLLYSQPDRWTHVQTTILRLAAEHFSRERFHCRLIEAMSHLGTAPPDHAASGRHPALTSAGVR